MNRIVLTMVIALLATSAARAEDIDGSWTASQVTKNGQLIGGGGGGLKFVFNKGQFKSTAPGGDKEGTYQTGSGRLDLKFMKPDEYTINCTYTLNGKNLTYKFKRGTDTIEVLLTRD